MTTNSTYKRDQVVGIINSVLGKIKTPSGPGSHEVLERELGELKEIIENMRKQLHESSVSEIGKKHIPSATDELDAIVGTTEQATQTIMDSCEAVLEIMKDERPEIFAKVENHIVKVFEACTFQDITGQRIKKVVKCLKEIDDKTRSILKTMGSEIAESKGEEEKETVVSLLNGPALPKDAVSQEDIDKLLAEFDSNN